MQQTSRNGNGSGAVHVQTNAAPNEAITFRRADDGSLDLIGSVATGGDGTPHLTGFRRSRAVPPVEGGMIPVNRNVSILSVVLVMTVTVMATVAVAFATPNKGGSSQENGQGNGLEKVPLCHNGHTITVGEPAVVAHIRHGDT